MMATYFMGGQSNLAGIILGGEIKANRFINNTIASVESRWWRPSALICGYKEMDGRTGNENKSTASRIKKKKLRNI
jgi:hypothetical protein